MAHRTDQPPEQPSPGDEALALEALVNTVSCPTCRAATGAVCTTRTSKPAREPHGRRIEALEQAAGITQHRAAVRAQKPQAWWSNGVDSVAETALLVAYAARVLPRLAVAT